MELHFKAEELGKLSTPVASFPKSTTPKRGSRWKIEALLAEKSDVSSRPVKEMYGAVLDREETFVKDMVNYCDNHDYLNNRKKEILHKTWSDQVYEPVRTSVIEQMDNGQNYPAYQTRKNQLYREYIEHLNKKGHVFRDDYDPSEYYAMGLHANRPYVVEGLQANTGKLRDPTLLQEANAKKEDQVIIRCTSGEVYNDKSLDVLRLPTLPLAPQGRHGTDNDTWAAMKLTDIESDIRKASSGRLRSGRDSLFQYSRALPLHLGIDEVATKRMVGTNLRADIDFGNWSVRTYGKETVDKELGIQKRKQCRQPPFTSPHQTRTGARKRLPAAKESHKSRTIPLTNAKYLDYEYDTPFATDMPLKPATTPSQSTLQQMTNSTNDGCNEQLLKQTDIVV